MMNMSKYSGIYSKVLNMALTNKALWEDGAIVSELLNAIPTPVFYKDRDGRYIGFNRAFETFSGQTKGRLIGKTVLDIKPPRLASIYHAEETELLSSGGRKQYEAQVKNANGVMRDVIFNKAAFTNTQGDILGLIGAILDITELKQTEERLLKSEQMFKSLFEQSNDAIILHDFEGRILDVNSRATEMLNCHKSKLLTLKIFDLHPEDIPQNSYDAFNETLEKGYVLFRTKFKKPDESIIDVEISSRIIDPQKGLIQGIIRDITERLSLEKRLLQAQKMESIGTLAGGIAHDFNNILSPILVCAEMSMQELPSGSPVLQKLQTIYQAGERARYLAKQILTFAHNTEEDRMPIKIKSLVEEAIIFLRSTIPSTIDIKFNSGAIKDTVIADPTQINEIVMNLSTNAAYAMRKKVGTLEVSLANEHIRPDEFDGNTKLIPGHYIRMSVKDTGDGIPPDIITKIFEPYFTTKPPGEGTGLGLAVIHGIVKNYCGDITVESKVGKGTTFKVMLPVVDKVLSPVVQPFFQLPRGNERILFVDDEVLAVEPIQAMLENLGYSVTTQTNSIEALKTFCRNPEAFDLVITDQTMPNITGKELLKKMISIRSDLNVILCTGFSEQIDGIKAKKIGASAFVLKPIVMREIAYTIRRVLDNR